MLEVVQDGFNLMREVGEVFSTVFWGYLFLVVFDVVTGLVASAIGGKLDSSVSFIGLMKKVASMLSLAFISFVDVYFMMNGNIVKIGIGLLVIHEGLSIIENLSKSGVDLGFLKKFFDSKKIGDDK